MSSSSSSSSNTNKTADVVVVVVVTASKQRKISCNERKQQQQQQQQQPYYCCTKSLFGLLLVLLVCFTTFISFNEAFIFHQLPSQQQRQRQRQQQQPSFVCSTSTRQQPKQTHLILASTTFDEDDDDGIVPPNSPIIKKVASNVLDIAKECFENSNTGVFLSDPTDIKKLKRAVDQLEAVSSSSQASIEPSTIVGDWKLIVTTSKTNPTATTTAFAYASKKKKMTSGAKSSILQKAVQVVQRIRLVNPSDEDISEPYNRVDNVIELTPPKIVETIQNNFEKSPLKDLLPKALNPLEITKQKITLVHKARIMKDTSTNVLRTKISLQSIILNVAGKSQFLDTDGSDVLGLNVPLVGEILNSGNFDTTYVDDQIRISRGTIDYLDELRVFIKLPPNNNTLTNVTSSDELVDVLTTDEEKQAQQDVKDALELEKEDRVEDILESKESFESMVKETSQAVAREIRDLSSPSSEIADTFDEQFNKTFGKTPIEIISDQSSQAAGQIYDAGEQVLENLEEVVDFLETNITQSIPSESEARKNATAVALDARSNVPNEFANIIDDIVNATLGETPLQLTQDAAEFSVELAKNATELGEDILEDTEEILENFGENITKSIVNVNKTMTDEE